MKSFLLILILSFASFSFAQNKDVLKEPKPKYHEDIVKEEQKLSKAERKKLKKQRAPHKPAEPKKEVKPDPTENLEQQIQDADQSDLSNPEE